MKEVLALSITRSFVFLAAAVIFSVGWSERARAVPIFFDFTFVGTSGSESGTIGTGSFSIEGSLFTETGAETFRPAGAGFGIEGLLSFDVLFAGDNFSMPEDVGFPQTPAVSFVDGVLGQFNFTTSSQDIPNITLLDNGLIAGFAYEDGNGITEGSFLSLPTRRAASVPEPGALWLLGLGLAALFILRPRVEAAPA